MTTKARTNMSTPSPRAPKIWEAVVTMNVRAEEGVTKANDRKDKLETDKQAADMTNYASIDRGSYTMDVSAMLGVQRSTLDMRKYEYKNLASNKPTEILVRQAKSIIRNTSRRMSSASPGKNLLW